MYDKIRIERIILDINKYKNKLNNYSIKKIEDLDDDMKFDAVSMAVFTILNRFLDLSKEILTSEEIGYPENYAEIPSLLIKIGVINSEQSKNLIELIKIRNDFSHFYQGMTKKEIFWAIERMQLVDKIISIIKKRVSTKKNGI
ncbi:MAG: HepT-like ribonuclease domain-containing protein [Nanoarchaeota archaeon]